MRVRVAQVAQRGAGDARGVARTGYRPVQSILWRATRHACA